MLNLGLGRVLFLINHTTPPKIKIDTQNDGLEKSGFVVIHLCRRFHVI